MPKEKGTQLTKSLVIVYSYHHLNTAKIADKFAEILPAEVKSPGEVDVALLPEYDLIGFGAGIDSGRHYRPLLDFVDTLPEVTGQRAFVFSTSAVQGKAKVAKDHATLRKRLVAKGYVIVDEFSCKGFNTNSFLKYFGGMNKGRPDSADLLAAAEFAMQLRAK